MQKENKPLPAATTATTALQLLWGTAFFTGWRSQSSIVAELAKRGYNFGAPELGMALKRAKHLTRRGGRGSYEYIQKYPHAEHQ